MELTGLIHDECARFGVPGAAVAAVANGDVVLSQGFGRRNEHDPVTARTRYMLASDTKCFAAASLCVLVEEGLLDLDEPIQTYLPWFAMRDDSLSGLVTSLDLLAHRTGLPRHSLMTIGDGDFAITNEDIARRMRFLQCSRPFRQGFGYSNVHYATAGHVAEVVSGKPWRELLHQRILEPLGMAGTTTYRPSLTAEDFAAPHAHGSWLPFQTRPYDLPSGGIVTHADDLSLWLLARLGGAALSDEVLALLHAPVVPSGEALPFPELQSQGYALGNLAFDYRGHRLHMHGGNQVGFSSQVIVLPGAQIGVAVLTNDHGSTLPLALGLTIVDHLLGLAARPWGERLNVPKAPSDAPTRVQAPPVRDLHEYIGTFHDPGYGSLSLDVRDSALAVSFHGLGDALRLTHLADDNWLLGLHDLPEMTVPVSFGSTAAGNIADLRVRVDPELPPLVFRRQ